MKKNNLLYRNNSRFITLGLILILLIGMIAGPVFANTEIRSEAFVYSISAFDGQLYQSAFTPTNVDTIYLMADEASIISPRNTTLYYWAITNRYEADWLAKNETIDSVLEIKDGNQLIASIPSQEYVIQYDSVDPVGSRTLALKDEAKAAYDAFVEARKIYKEKQSEYVQAYQAYTDEVSRIVSEADGKELTRADFPDEPETVANFTLFSTEINWGFPIALAEGEYSIALRLPDGTIQEGSEKKLVIFSKIKDGVAYKVIPSQRWTDPDYSKEEGGVIYSPNHSELYLEPYLQTQYNELAYQRMIDPQNTTARANRNIWVSFETYQEGKLSISQVNEVTREESLQRYKVTQLKSSGLGYSIDLFDPLKDEQSSFVGYSITVNDKNNEYQIALLDKNGDLLAGSNRQVYLLNTNHEFELYMTSVIPLVIGFIVILLRRKSVKHIKIEDKSA